MENCFLLILDTKMFAISRKRQGHPPPPPPQRPRREKREFFMSEWSKELERFMFTLDASIIFFMATTHLRPRDGDIRSLATRILIRQGLYDGNGFTRLSPRERRIVEWIILEAITRYTS